MKMSFGNGRLKTRTLLMCALKDGHEMLPRIQDHHGLGSPANYGLICPRLPANELPGPNIKHTSE